jgi:spoIIIJ-associated protein
MDTTLIQTVITELLVTLGVTPDSVVVETMAGQTLFSILVPDPRALIGPRGETLRAFELIIKKIAEHRGIESEHYTVDVNGFRKEQIQEIQTRAKMMAERARSFQYDVELPPMSAYERLIVHATLGEMQDLKTESQGEGKNRRVVIKYKAA